MDVSSRARNLQALLVPVGAERKTVPSDLRLLTAEADILMPRACKHARQ